MKKFLLKKRIVCFAILILLFFSCSKNTPEETVVAKLNNEKITFRELEESLWLNPHYSKRAPLKTVRENQLNFLISERRYYLAARQIGLDSDTLIRPKLKYIKDQEVLKGYLETKFLKKIRVDKKELRQGLEMYQKVLRVQNFYFRNKELADKVEAELANGENLEQVVEKIYRDEGLRKIKGEAVYITFGDFDPEIEKVAYSLKKGEISRPVASRYGYHILRVLDIQPNRNTELLSSEMKFEYVRQIIRRRKADSLIHAYLSRLANGRKIQINNRVIDFLTDHTRQVMGKDYETPALFKPIINNKEIADIRLSLKEAEDEVVARFGNEEMTVKDFLNRLREMPPFQRPYLSTRKRMIQSIIDMIRNDLLLKEAYAEGIDRIPEVRKRYRRFQKTFLAEEFYRRLKSEHFKKTNPQQWEAFQSALQEIAWKFPPKILYANLFKDVKNPDSIMVDAPFPLVIKSRYEW